MPKTSAIAGVDGVLNAVALETDHVHELLLAGPGAGGPPTASSVLSDILDIARGTRVPPLGVPSHELTPYRQAPMRAHEGGYYIRLNAKDIPGALAAIASRMGAAGISLESVIQRPDLRVTRRAERRCADPDRGAAHAFDDGSRPCATRLRRSPATVSLSANRS